MGMAPVAPNHFAGYFEGKVAIVDGSEANDYVLTSDANGLATWKDPCTLSCNGGASTAWSLTGNAASTSNFIGTTTAQPLNFRTNGVHRARLNAPT